MPTNPPIQPEEYGELRACAAMLRNIAKRTQRLRISGIEHDYELADLGRLEEVIDQAEGGLHRVANVADSYLADPAAKEALSSWMGQPSGNAVGEPIRGR